ncbi:CBS domain-containing protein [Thiomonas sp.]|uniref:CBS domain-containing protein n=1 Tax=Thiomonas sp. TaxID=2047785 RepID=UPI0026097C43|nr:CBS domain-containing protein [Thiomonas sp.]
MGIYRSLHTSILPPHARLCEVDLGRHASVDMEAPATSVMTDLRQVRAVTITPDSSVEAAQQRMIHAHVRMLLVVDGDDSMLGLLTARDLLGEKPIRVAVEDGVSRDAIAVERVMIRPDHIQVLDYADVLHSSVGDIVKTMSESGRQHALVVERRHTPSVRGIFSITQIGRQLGVALEASERPQSFAEVEHLLAST